MTDPKHLGKNWVGFDFAKALGKPVRIINDAALQALGSYRGKGRMLFLGLGTGLGSALVWPEHVLPLELGDLPYVNDGIIEDRLGDEGLQELGRKRWEREAVRAIPTVKQALIADYVVLGGGNAKVDRGTCPMASNSATTATLIPVAAGSGKPIRKASARAGASSRAR